MPLEVNTRRELAAYLERVTLAFVQTTPITLIKPYHEALLPTIPWSPLSEHSFATRTGSWFSSIAKIVCKQYHPVVETGYTLDGRLRSAASSVIADILRQLDQRPERRIPNRGQDISDVLRNQSEGGETTSWIVDFYVRRADGREFCFELKTPQPNKSHCREMKAMILTTSAMRKGQPFEAYGACGYNPYAPDGAASPYGWNMTKQFLQIGEDFLIGRQFWEKVAEPTTFDEIWDVAREVGRGIADQVNAVVEERRSRLLSGREEDVALE